MTNPRRRSRRRTEGPKFPDLKPLAQKLESLRFERGWTQSALAARAGISTNHYQDISQANANPSFRVVLALATALGVKPGDLFKSVLRPADDGSLRISAADLEGLRAAAKRLVDLIKRLGKRRRRRRSN